MRRVFVSLWLLVSVHASAYATSSLADPSALARPGPSHRLRTVFLFRPTAAPLQTFSRQIWRLPTHQHQVQNLSLACCTCSSLPLSHISVLYAFHAMMTFIFGRHSLFPKTSRSICLIISDGWLLRNRDSMSESTVISSLGSSGA